MTSNQFDAIVLGTGGVGSAALYALAARGKKVIGLDAHSPGHDRGSSHGESRVIRQAYFEHPDYVPLALAAYELWDEIESRSGHQLFWRTGLLQAGPADGVVLSGVIQSAEQHGLDIERLDADQLQQRFSQFQIPTHMAGVFEPAAGYLLVEELILLRVDMY